MNNYINIGGNDPAWPFLKRRLEEKNIQLENSADYLAVLQAMNDYRTAQSPTTADASVLKEALERIARMQALEGREGCYWGETEFDSPSAAKGYSECLEICKDVANKALAQYNAGSQGEQESIIDKCETAVGVLRTMLKKLKMPCGVEAADTILMQIKAYRLMNPKEDTGPYSMPIPAQEPLQSTLSDQIEEITCVFCEMPCEPAPTKRGWSSVRHGKGLHFDCAGKVCDQGNAIGMKELEDLGKDPLS